MSKQSSSINEGFTVWKDIIVQYQPQKTLLVCGKRSYESVQKIVAPLIARLSGDLIIFDEFGKSPRMEDIFRGTNLCHNEQIDMIIAVGGGHCIDTAKAINILSFQSYDPKDVYSIAGYIRGTDKLVATTRPLIVMPTTSGSGSEATHFAVVYIESDKFSLSHPSILPDWVIADKTLVQSMPPNIAVATALDALCQAIESYWSIGATKESEFFAMQSLEIISPHMTNDFKLNEKFFLDMVSASNYSGRAINLSKTTAPHSLSYYLTDKFNITHGIAVALTLGTIATHTEKHGDSATKKKINTVKNILNFPNDFATSWYQFMTTLGIPHKLSDYHIEPQHLNQMIASVNLQRLANHPLRLTSEDLSRILNQCYA